jgi:hypothetical protein
MNEKGQGEGLGIGVLVKHQVSYGWGKPYIITVAIYT